MNELPDIIALAIAKAINIPKLEEQIVERTSELLANKLSTQERYRKLVINRPEQSKILRKLRIEQDLTQKELARLAGTTQPRISDIERGAYAQGFMGLNLARISKALFVDVEELLPEEK